MVAPKNDVSGGSRSAWNFNRSIASSVRGPVARLLPFYVCCAQPTVEIWVRQCSSGLDKDHPHVHTHLSQTRSLFAPTDLVIAVHALAIWLVCYANHTGLPQPATPPFLSLLPSPYQLVPPPLQPSYQEMHCTRPHAEPCLHRQLIATLHIHVAPLLQDVVLQQHVLLQHAVHQT